MAKKLKFALIKPYILEFICPFRCPPPLHLKDSLVKPTERLQMGQTSLKKQNSNILSRARGVIEKRTRNKLRETVMAAKTSLVSYDSDSSTEEINSKDLPDEDENTEDNTVDIAALKSKFLLNSAPIVNAKVKLRKRKNDDIQI